jgi:hypothetical protein
MRIFEKLGLTKNIYQVDPDPPKPPPPPPPDGPPQRVLD